MVEPEALDVRMKVGLRVNQSLKKLPFAILTPVASQGIMLVVMSKYRSRAGASDAKRHAS